MTSLLRKPELLILIFSFLFFIVIHVTFAASDSFTVSTLIGDDTTPPTTPANLSATPVATTQIDLSWSASTDNFSLSGYQVFRDSVQIATTTVTSYSDTGLTESTLYTYYVTAYDSVGNVSSSSSPVSTTTLATPIVPEPEPEVEDSGGGDSGGSPALRIVSLEVIPGTTFAVINWHTAGYTRSVLRWGKTTSYELGSVAENSFSLTHTTLISGLEPGTIYQFSIGGENGVGAQRVLVNSSFTTLREPDNTPPSNVTNLEAKKIADDIQLTWDNPREQDFSYVRILRSDRFYPSDLVDGALIYEGSGEAFLDKGSAVPSTTQYFTLFSYDERGNVSSGAVVALRIDGQGNVVEVDIGDIPLSPDAVDISIEDLIFEQEGMRLDSIDGKIHIDGTKQLTLSLLVEKVPRRLKSIVVTVYEGELSEKSFSFLLRIDEDGTRYTASVAPFTIDGTFPIRVSIFDYGVEKIAETEGTLVASIAALPSSITNRDYLPYFLILLAFLLVTALGLIVRGRWGSSVVGA